MLFLWAIVTIVLIFMWIFLLPIFVVGFCLSIPFFVVALPLSLVVAAGIYISVDHIKESSLREILSSAPFEAWFGEIVVPIPKGNHLICCHPHGMICTMAVFGIHFQPKSKTLIAVAPVVFVVPIIGWIAKHLGAIPATYEDIGRALEHTSVILLPGGVPEIICTERGLQYTQRWGFLKCVQDNFKIICVRGHESYYDIIPLPLYDLRLFIAKKYNIPIVFPWIFGYCGTWIPKPKPIKPTITVYEYDKNKNVEENRKQYYEWITG